MLTIWIGVIIVIVIVPYAANKKLNTMNLGAWRVGWAGSQTEENKINFQSVFLEREWNLTSKLILKVLNYGFKAQAPFSTPRLESKQDSTRNR